MLIHYRSLLCLHYGVAVQIELVATAICTNADHVFDLILLAHISRVYCRTVSNVNMPAWHTNTFGPNKSSSFYLRGLAALNRRSPATIWTAMSTHAQLLICQRSRCSIKFCQVAGALRFGHISSYAQDDSVAFLEQTPAPSYSLT